MTSANGSTNKLPYFGSVALIDALADDFKSLINGKIKNNKNKREYKIAYEESMKEKRDDRKNVLSRIVVGKSTSFKKVAFDTRRIDQENTRNPRSNLQYWHRSQPFIDASDQGKINIFAKLAATLNDLKVEFGTRPDWHESYARVLNDAVQRALRIKQGDQDIDSSQLSYLEQLLNTRYRLTMDELSVISHDDLRKRILSKDENLLKRGVIFDDSKKEAATTTSIEHKFIELLMAQAQANMQANLIKNNNAPVVSQESALASLFGGGVRRDGERIVERTVTITIRDEVKD
jgi:hypothetical protein